MLDWYLFEDNRSDTYRNSIYWVHSDVRGVRTGCVFIYDKTLVDGDRGVLGSGPEYRG